MARALARRAAAQHGPARVRMAERVSQWLAAACVPAAPEVPGSPGARGAPGSVDGERPDGSSRPGGSVGTDGLRDAAGADGTIGAERLEDSIGAQHALAALTALVERLGRAPATPARPGSPRAEAPPLKALAAHAGTWSRLRVQQRLRQALAQVPAQAGPLHTARLVHRALQTLHDLAPAYLDAFVAQVESLQWLEQASGGDLPTRAPGRGPEPARRVRKRPAGAAPHSAG